MTIASEITRPMTMPAPNDNAGQSRVARKRAERMKSILRVAAQVFAERGYERTNLEEIAARANMRGPSLYYYVPTKEELYTQCVESLGEEVFAMLESVANGKEPAARRLHELFRTQLLTQLRDFYPDYVPLMPVPHFSEPALRDRILACRHQHIAIFQRVGEEAAAEGAIDKGWRLGLRLIFGALGSLHEWYDPKGPLSAEELSERIAVSFMRLLAACRT
jgi:AcrR family transcriptional regulator